MNIKSNLIRLQAPLRQLIHDQPFLRKVVLIIYDKIWFLEFKISPLFFRTNLFTKNSMTINPKLIKYQCKSKKLKNKWDLQKNLYSLDKSIKYKSFYQHFIEKVNWEKTEYYIIRKEKFLKKSVDSELINTYFNSINNIYEIIKNEEVSFEKNLDQKDNILCGISRNGDFIALKGTNRLIIAKILNLEQIPVKIVIRHPNWSKFRSQIFTFLKLHGLIYQPLIHPDLIGIKPSYDEKRFIAIKENLTIKKGTLLDIGANFGYFCHKFEDLGFDCYAIELLNRNIYFMKKLKQIEHKNFKIINKSIFDFTEKSEFDVVLALNIFHHFLKDKVLYKRLIVLLKRLKMKEMYFQAHSPTDFLNKKFYKNYSPEEFVDFIVRNSCLKNAKLIFEDKEQKGRKLYKLSV